VPKAAANPSKAIKPAWVSLEAWARSRSLPPPKRRTTDPLPTFELSTPAGAWVVRPGTEITLWNGVQLRLAFAPLLTNSGTVVHSFDLAKTIDPLLSKSAGTVSPAPVVVLDPGHGGQDSGTRSVLPGKFEKDLTLDWALRLRDLLTARGWQVKLTRTNDCDLSIPARVAFAEEVKADLFVSLHFNSAGAKNTEAGLETYCLTPAGMPSNLTRGYPDDLRTSFPNNTFDDENLRLALILHRELLQTSRMTDRGIRRARFLGVLRGQQRPAVLVEGGYLSNAAEARLITSAAYRQKLADALAKALIEWSGTPGTSQQVAAGVSPSGE
jgi:N-acetylmuramoyl-L-alanine amidase